MDDLLSRVETRPMAGPLPGGAEASAQAMRPAAPNPGAAPFLCRIAGLDSDGRVLLDAPMGASPDAPAPSGPLRLAARSTVPVTLADAGREALTVLAGGDPAQAVIIGLLQAGAPADAPPAVLHLEAGRELVLKCGQATLKLTRDGRIVIRGADVLTRSSGSHRIKGGSVQIN